MESDRVVVDVVISPSSSPSPPLSLPAPYSLTTSEFTILTSCYKQPTTDLSNIAAWDDAACDQKCDDGDDDDGKGGLNNAVTKSISHAAVFVVANALAILGF